MKIAYLVEDTSVSGGVRVQLAHADALIDRGHHVRLVSKGAPVTWRTSRADWIHVDDFNRYDASDDDFVVAGFWTSVAPAWTIAGERAVHLCQGYEGTFTAYRSIRAEIEAAYRLPLPKIVVSKHLVEVCKQFTDDVTYVGQIVDDVFFQPRQPHTGRPRVLLVGPMQIDFKGIDIGYAAIEAASGAGVDVVRVAQWPPEPDEPKYEFHVGLSSAEMARIIASCDIFLGPSRPDEGFGLPAAEAMASGLPAVLTKIPSFLSFDDHHDYALFGADAGELAQALVRLLSDGTLRERIAKRGREVVEQFRAANTGERLDRYFANVLARRRTSGR